MAAQGQMVATEVPLTLEPEHGPATLADIEQQQSIEQQRRMDECEFCGRGFLGGHAEQ